MELRKVTKENDMPIYDYKCPECGYVNEYYTGISIPKAMQPPDTCPSCCKSKLERLFSPQGQSFDIIGSCYMNDYGKHAWKKHNDLDSQAKILSGEQDPY